MHRLLATVVFAYAGVSAAHWCHASGWFDDTSGGLRCGNVISDPFNGLVNVVGPIAALCVGLLIYRCIKTLRLPFFAVMAIMTFVVTSAGLAYEALVFLPDYGIDLPRVWWRFGM